MLESRNNVLHYNVVYANHCHVCCRVVCCVVCCMLAEWFSMWFDLCVRFGCCVCAMWSAVCCSGLLYISLVWYVLTVYEPFGLLLWFAVYVLRGLHSVAVVCCMCAMWFAVCCWGFLHMCYVVHCVLQWFAVCIKHSQVVKLSLLSIQVYYSDEC